MPSEDVLRAVYRVRAGAAEIAARADALLLEQTVEVPRALLVDPRVVETAVGRVAGVAPDGDCSFRVTLEQPAAATAHDPAQLLNVLFGNSSLQPDVELVDLELPASLVEMLGGPRHGLSGLRRLAAVDGRALTCSTLKPMGLPADALAGLARTFALAGLDVVKDDHGLADHDFCPFEQRVRACVAALRAAEEETGTRALYVPNVTGTPATVERQALRALELGADAVMVAPMLVGLPLLHELTRQIDCPVLAHPAFAGSRRIDPAALLGVLFPLYGADGVIFTSFGGRFAESRDTCLRLVSELRAPRAPIRPALPIAGGGMQSDRVGAVLEAYGADVVVLVGGSLLEAGDRLLERSRELVERVRDFPYP